MRQKMWCHVVLFLEFLMLLFNNVSGRFCEGGHICSLPRECCTQGCCPPYQGGPRQLPPPSEHVLNLFFISHWFFWCVVVAVILAILCAYSLWKKRRTLCGWGFTEHHAQSEGDSAGSCYAPPQYSRCNSFHHPPPPYTEVTSKPDLYPLVFTCNSDNGKNGSSYLMVQYFRNYIVRPAGSLSAASTVDSLSSSFICNANEANTLVPPPYSRAASPELSYSNCGSGAHYQQQQHQQQQQQQQQRQQSQQHYNLPRSASQLVCAQQDFHIGNGIGVGGINIAAQQVYQQQQQQHQHNQQLQQQQQQQRSGVAHYATLTLNGAANANGGIAQVYSARLPNSESVNFIQDESGASSRSGSGSASQLGGNNNNNNNVPTHGAFMQSQSDQHFRYMANSNSSISDIFVNNSCTAGLGSGGGGGGSGGGGVFPNQNANNAADDASLASLAIGGGTPVIFTNGCIKPNPLHRANTNPTQFTDLATNAAQTHDGAVYNSCNSIGGISITIPVNGNAQKAAAAAAAAPGMIAGVSDGVGVGVGVADNEFRDLQLLRRSLETCCQLLQHQQQPQPHQHQHHHHHPHPHKHAQHQTAPPPLSNAHCQHQQQQQQQQLNDSPQRMRELVKKYNDDSSGQRSYVTSGTVSDVSSLATIGTPTSPPQATSPTGEVKEILDQIRQLQAGVSYEEIMLATAATSKPKLHHTMSSPSPTTTTTHSTKRNSMETHSPLTPSPTPLQRYASVGIAAGGSSSDQQLQQRTTMPTLTVTTTPARNFAAAAGSVGGFGGSSSTQRHNQGTTTSRPSNFLHTQKKIKTKFYTPKPNKALYMPMVTSGTTPTATPPMSTHSSRSVLKSPVSSATFFVNRGGRSRIGWITRSAPTTPGTSLPPNRLGDDSPLLHEHDEDAEGEQNAELD